LEFQFIGFSKFGLVGFLDVGSVELYAGRWRIVGKNLDIPKIFF
jgi:hypothetical protein